jgi:glycolate oxidase iron-sulfur subunit
VQVKDYGHALAHDPDYAEKARRGWALTRDLSALLPQIAPNQQGRQPPTPQPAGGGVCTLDFFPGTNKTFKN